MLNAKFYSILDENAVRKALWIGLKVIDFMMRPLKFF